MTDAEIQQRIASVAAKLGWGRDWFVNIGGHGDPTEFTSVSFPGGIVAGDTPLVLRLLDDASSTEDVLRLRIERRLAPTPDLVKLLNERR